MWNYVQVHVTTTLKNMAFVDYTYVISQAIEEKTSFFSGSRFTGVHLQLYIHRYSRIAL